MEEQGSSGAQCEDRYKRHDVISFGRRKELMAMATKIAADLNAPAVKSNERPLLRRMVEMLLVDE